MNYERIYKEFIEDRYTKQPNHIKDGSSEMHHILPKSMGGTDDKSNLIRLKTSEHLFAHLLLAKIYGGVMWIALRRMVTSQQSSHINKKHRFMFEQSRVQSAKENSKMRKGKKLNLTEEQLRQRSERVKGEKNPMYGKVGPNKGKSWSDEIKKKQSEAKKGEKNPMYGTTHNRCGGKNNPMYGKKHSEDTIKKMKESLKRVEKKKCPHCGKLSSPAMAKRWHFDKCKLKGNNYERNEL